MNALVEGAFILDAILCPGFVGGIVGANQIFYVTL
jgi:hypothetical protein